MKLLVLKKNRFDFTHEGPFMIKRIVFFSCMASCIGATKNSLYQPYGIPVYPQQGQVIMVPQQERQRSFVRGVTKFAFGTGCLFGAYLCAQKAQAGWGKMSSSGAKATKFFTKLFTKLNSSIDESDEPPNLEEFLIELGTTARPYAEPLGWGAGSAVLGFTGLKCIVSAVRNDL
jgi:hypothetical protein